jgi:hypothetical protein
MARNQQIQNFIDALEQATGISVDADLTAESVTIEDGDGDTLHITEGGRVLVSIPEPLETTTPSTTTGSSYGFVGVDGSQTLVLSSNENRESVLLQNKGAEAVYIGLDGAVTPPAGIEVAPGGTYADDTYTGDLFAITGGGSVDVAFQEIATE